MNIAYYQQKNNSLEITCKQGVLYLNFEPSSRSLSIIKAP